MKKLLTLLMLVCACVFSNLANSAVLEWDRNSETNVAGYNVYIGTASRTYSYVINVGDDILWVLSNSRLSVGTTYFFAVTAYTADGLESDFSDEVFYTPKATDFEIRPLPPVRARISGTQSVSVVVEATKDLLGEWVPLDTIILPEGTNSAQFLRIQPTK